MDREPMAMATPTGKLSGKYLVHWDHILKLSKNSIVNYNLNRVFSQAGTRFTIYRRNGTSLLRHTMGCVCLFVSTCDYSEVMKISLKVFSCGVGLSQRDNFFERFGSYFLLLRKLIFVSTVGCWAKIKYKNLITSFGQGPMDIKW